MFTPQERRLQVFLWWLGIIYSLAIFGYIVPGLIEPTKHIILPPFIVNSVAKIGVLALISFIAAANVRRFRILSRVIALGNCFAVIAGICTLIWGDTSASYALMGGVYSTTTLILASSIADGVVTAILISLYLSADKSQYDLAYLSPSQFRTLVALADVMFNETKHLISEVDIARNVDRYLSSFRAKTKLITALALNVLEIYPIFSLKAPLSLMNPGDRLSFVKKRFYRDTTLKLQPEFYRVLTQAMIRMGQQLCYIGYYNDPRTFESVGYTPFSKRPETPAKLSSNPPAQRIPLQVMTGRDITEEVISADVVIIGTGAGAAIAARGLVEQGREVLMIERGDHVDPSTFNEDEMDMMSRLYADGALQQSKDFRFRVLQGSCVGGTTVINNAVCFDMPDYILDQWNDKEGINANLDANRVWKSFSDVRNIMSITQQNPTTLNPGAQAFVYGTQALGFDKAPDRLSIVDANIKDCYGCGYCNIGCSYGKKLSMLDTVLPQTQQKYGPHALRILASCEAVKLRGTGNKITSVTCQTSDGRRIDVKGKTFVVAAGAVSSSLLLLRSGVGGRTVGKRLSFNMGSPITAVFDNVMNSYAGLQISHYLRLTPNRGYIMETWFNPPLAQALTMPGWFEDHFNNMKRYNKMSCAGILVGSEPNAVAQVAGLTGREIDYEPTPGDFQKLLDGIILSGNIFLAAGAKAVMPATFKYYEFHNSDELANLPNLVKDSSDLTIGTGHPQGGNALSLDPKIGVVDNEFKIYGYDNIYITDASVFPTSLGVNPQLTVMSLAHYAAPFIAANKG
ncbi:MAG: GMC family oxidoreductase N-terminal domain-containing protein [Bacteroidota bacterium]|nr:GMC family oxidoreductase N-terminal domain-containing protein [Bacteroidota bacterium]